MGQVPVLNLYALQTEAYLCMRIQQNNKIGKQTVKKIRLSKMSLS